jgi:two-component system chemotaxis response regulator CheB
MTSGAILHADLSASSRRAKVVVIGASWGGLHAMQAILGGLPADYPLPIAFVQHRGKETYETLTAVLQARSALPVIEAEDKMPFAGPGVFVAPSDYHLMVDQGVMALSTDEPVGFSRPSIDVLFESAAETYGADVIGVLLTGANRDGGEGLRRIVECGGRALVQDPLTAESRAMPEAGIDLVPNAFVVPLDQIAAALIRMTRQSSIPPAVGGRL